MTDQTCARPGCGHLQADHGALTGCTHLTWKGPDGYCRCSAYVAPTPALPYDGGTSSGHSGSDASAQRSARRDANGATRKVQDGVLEYVREYGVHGATIQEVRDAFPGDHHGTLSGALSNLHAKGLVVRLAVQRNGAQVYVTPDMVDGREAVAHGRRTARGRGRLTPDERAAVQRVRAIMPTGDVPGDHRTSLGTHTLATLLGALERLS